MHVHVALIGMKGVGKYSWFKTCFKIEDDECSYQDRSFEYNGNQYSFAVVEESEKYKEINDYIIDNLGKVDNGAAILIFSITSKVSFDILSKRIDKIRQNTSTIVIIGSKCDLESKRQVLKEEGEAFAKTINANYFEVSSTMNINCFNPLNEIHHSTKEVRQRTTLPFNIFLGMKKFGKQK